MWFCWWPPEEPWAYQAGSHRKLNSNGSTSTHSGKQSCFITKRSLFVVNKNKFEELICARITQRIVAQGCTIPTRYRKVQYYEFVDIYFQGIFDELRRVVNKSAINFLKLSKSKLRGGRLSLPSPSFFLSFSCSLDEIGREISRKRNTYVCSRHFCGSIPGFPTNNSRQGDRDEDTSPTT